MQPAAFDLLLGAAALSNIPQLKAAGLDPLDGSRMTRPRGVKSVESHGLEAQSLVPGIAKAIRAGAGTPRCALNLKRNEPLDDGLHEPVARANLADAA